MITRDKQSDMMGKARKMTTVGEPPTDKPMRKATRPTKRLKASHDAPRQDDETAVHVSSPVVNHCSDDAECGFQLSDRGQAIIISSMCNTPDINMPTIFRTKSDDEEIFSNDDCKLSDSELPPPPPPPKKKKTRKRKRAKTTVR